MSLVVVKECSVKGRCYFLWWVLCVLWLDCEGVFCQWGWKACCLDGILLVVCSALCVLSL